MTTPARNRFGRFDRKDGNVTPGPIPADVLAALAALPEDRRAPIVGMLALMVEQAGRPRPRRTRIRTEPHPTWVSVR